MNKVIIFILLSAILIFSSKEAIAQSDLVLKLDRINLHSLDVEAKYKPFLTKSFEILDSVLGTQEFKKRLKAKKYQEAYVYHGRKKIRFNSEELYDYIMTGHEFPQNDRLNLQCEANKFDFWIKNDSCDGKAAGHVSSSHLEITLCYSSLEQNMALGNYASMCRTIFHEYLHTMGFNHLRNFDEANRKSVVYRVAYIVQVIVKESGY